MSDVSQLLDSALHDEPHYLPDVPGIIDEARRRSRNRRLAAAGSSVAVTAGIGALALSLGVGAGSPPAHDAAGAGSTPSGPVARVTQVSGPTQASSRPVDTSDGISGSNFAALIEQDAGVSLSHVVVSHYSTPDDVGLTAGIADVGGTTARNQYLDAMVSTAGTMVTKVPTCADLNGYTHAEWDFYRGACHVSLLPGGGYLSVRSGRTPNGKYAITQATLVHADGSGVEVEATNQRNVSLVAFTHNPTGYLVKRNDPVVSHDPPVSAAALADLVHQLDAQR